MNNTGTERDHWDRVYRERDDADVSWYQQKPELSLRLIEHAVRHHGDPIIDVGGGASRRSAYLLDAGHTDLTVLDISETALDRARSALGERADLVDWIVADITQWRPTRAFKVWHDRAVFHFLTGPDDRRAYTDALRAGLEGDGLAIIATFAPDGPSKCSGLPIVRYSPDELANTLGPEFRLIGSESEIHTTPGGRAQSFQYSCFKMKQGGMD